MRRLFATAALLLLPAGIALGSEPSSGEISKASPSVVWTGSTTNSWFNYTLIASDNTAECTAPLCDSFTLKVADGGVDLVVKARMDSAGSDGTNGTGGLRITPPEGDPIWASGESGPDQDLKVTVKKAPAGEYVIDFTNTFVGGEQAYAASAELLVPPPPVVAAPAVPAAPAPAAAPAATLTVKPFTAKASKRLKAKVSSTGELTGVTAVLARGGKRLATAKLARLDGTRRLSLKLKKKPRPGRYLLTVKGKDAGGRVVTAQAAVTIRR